MNDISENYQSSRESLASAALEKLRARLLDLTARNRLLNFRHTKTASLRIIDELPDQLWETLLGEREMRFQPVPEPTREQLLEAGYLVIDEETGQERRVRKDPSAEEWARLRGLETGWEMPVPEAGGEPSGKHGDSAIQTLLFPYELETRLRGLRQKAETAIEESGANILYLALGFLEWTEHGDEERKRLAPLSMLPVRLQRGRLNTATGTYEYTLSYTGEDILTNISLREKLRIDFGLALPDLDEETAPEAYLAAVEALVRENRPAWRVRRYVTLGLLNFSKQLMYLDLDPGRWPEGQALTAHPVVSLFLSGAGREEGKDEPGGETAFAAEYEIDAIESVHRRYPLIDDADSSQHSALIDAVEGKNLVIEGPPGTGKSQTITNLVAAALAQGKRVLFVAEKLAALEVVKRRLDQAGLGEFCLELHSHKSQKRKILDDINNRLQNRGSCRWPADIEAETARLESMKQTLRAHAEMINQCWKGTGRTMHQVLTAATRHRLSLGIDPGILHPDGLDSGRLDAEGLRRLGDQARAFGNVFQAVASQFDPGEGLDGHPWHGVRNGDLQVFETDRVCAALGAWQGSLEALEATVPRVAAALGVRQETLPAALAGLDALASDLSRLPELQGDEYLPALARMRGEGLAETDRLLALFQEIQALHGQLEGRVSAAALGGPEVAARLMREGSALRTLAAADATLAQVADGLRRMERLEARLQELAAPMAELADVLGEPGDRFAVHAGGLGEFSRFLELVAALPAEYWLLRESRFDDDELDRALPPLGERLDGLRERRDALAGHFVLEGLPPLEELEAIRRELAAGGALRWFRGAWRRARRSLLAIGAGGGQRFEALAAGLPELIHFLRDRDSLERDGVLARLLGAHFIGLDTDMEALRTLRGWYRRVRAAYGVGFGPNVALGDAVIGLPAELARTVRVLVEQGVVSRVEECLEELGRLAPVFAPVEELRSGHDVLSGSDGVLEILGRSLREALEPIHEHLPGEALSLREIGDRVGALERLWRSTDAWRTADLEGRYFDGSVRLQLGGGGDNAAALAAIAHARAIAQVVDSEMESAVLRQRFADVIEASAYDRLRESGYALREVMEAVRGSGEGFAGLADLDRAAWLNGGVETVPALLERNRLALDNQAWLGNWLDYVRERGRLAELGLAPLARAVESGALPAERAEEGCQAGVDDLLAREILRAHPELARFSGRSHEQIQASFRDYDERLKRLQSEQIAWKIDRRHLPAGIASPRAADLTERRLLERECSKKKRHIPIRQLLSRAGTALSALKPCFMMGPMSVAQYLEPGRLQFDIVVMDEASQIRPEDALGAVARGAQLVVVGDPKQLPPTSFFDRMIDEEDEDTTVIEDSESILDATLPVFPARRLRWHYRSQHESLIAFSNRAFYDNDLILFPSPHNVTRDYGVQLTRVHRGRFINRQNLEEAKLIAEAVREHLLHGPGETLGVVGMSAEQRDQVERAIETLAKDDGVFRAALERDTARNEPLFVKNLENVQGDERDVIFISMTYGPQEAGGRVMQRFGPINSNVGWRRLNVLFTRSRKRMHVFSSMGSDDIVAGPSSTGGVTALKGFLAYAESGYLYAPAGPTGRLPDSNFEVAVADALSRVGYECVPQVGVAGFFIDVAVRDPGNPGRYLLGIECDGATYHSAKSVRDRDCLRQKILERLGWRIRRIWSTDWYRNPQAELQPVLAELESLRTTPIPEEVLAEPEAERIETILAFEEKEEADLASLVGVEESLSERLRRFDEEVIRRELPGTPEPQRLLRPAMVEALTEYLPTSKWEFQERIPPYLRQATAAAEGQFLERIFEIIEGAQ